MEAWQMCFISTRHHNVDEAHKHTITAEVQKKKGKSGAGEKEYIFIP